MTTFSSTLELPVDELRPERLLAELDSHSLILVRNVDLDDLGYIRFAGALGRPEAQRMRGSHGELIPLLRNVTDGPDPIHDARAHFNAQWHADLSWTGSGRPVTLLLADRSGTAGPPTEFTDLVQATAALPPELRARIEGRRVMHHIAKSREIRHPEMQRIAAAQNYQLNRFQRWRERRTLRPIAELGVECLSFVAPPPPGSSIPAIDTLPSGEQVARFGDHAWTIEGMPEDEGIRLVDEINVALTSGPTWAHEWQPNDLLVFDNSRLLHRRSDPQCAIGGRRLRRIITVLDH